MCVEIYNLSIEALCESKGRIHLLLVKKIENQNGLEFFQIISDCLDSKLTIGEKKIFVLKLLNLCIFL